MAKTNFTKTEEALAAALEKMKVEELLARADAIAGKTNATQISHEQTHLIHSLQRDLKRLHRHDKEIYKKLGIKRTSLKKLFENAAAMSPTEWENLLVFKKQVDSYIQLLPAENSNDQLVAEARKKHINKRFNVSDKWLPLK
ncbi:MAG: hypothetical protein H0X51_09710 [Parachlamydiaceae bacterium]|nr:hypothetical protein [Parachlamydiaceae bacterium]